MGHSGGAMTFSDKATGGPLTGWFDRLVKNKMASVALSVAGIAVSCFLLSFSKIFDGFVYYVVSVTGSGMLISFALLFVYASVLHVQAYHKIKLIQVRASATIRSADTEIPIAPKSAE